MTFGPPAQTWHENLTLSGLHSGTRKTSEPGGFVVQQPQGPPPVYTGTLTNPRRQDLRVTGDWWVMAARQRC
jgi:hypothetical protein